MPISSVLAKWLPLFKFRGSASYWQERYRLGGDSGCGSVGAAAIYKALVINAFVLAYSASDVIEFGCGDGQQLGLAVYPRYLGLDISADAVALCRERFKGDPNKRFATLDEYRGESADVALSLDVLYHLVEDAVYSRYLETLFASARKFVIVYSTVATASEATLAHVRHRPVDADIAQRFPEFVRMTAEEERLPPPVEQGKGGWTRFLLYARR